MKDNQRLHFKNGKISEPSKIKLDTSPTLTNEVPDDEKASDEAPVFNVVRQIVNRISKDMDERISGRNERETDSDTVITLNPMQIRTFVVEIIKH